MRDIREEPTIKRQEAIKWWNLQHRSAKSFLCDQYFYSRIVSSLTGREIEHIWRLEKNNT